MTGRAALAIRSAALFKAVCLDVGAARARELVSGSGFRRAEAAEARAFLGSRAGEVWIREGYDTFVLTLTTAPTTRCEFGVRDLEFEGAADALHSTLVLWDRSTPRMPLRRDPSARATYRLAGGDGRPRTVEAVSQSNPGNVIRVVLVSEVVTP